eukprot:TRINITY_DN1054_c0_g1_i1.p1 TRINITY_DN1054_c0_g1~~TRINITY_DN1054_c0_g1_i1.p1  ORF type:complete len:884 (+),score=252.84 TRINITY_DN1054_c0_g1_i1:349-3000(+)
MTSWLSAGFLSPISRISFHLDISAMAQPAEKKQKLDDGSAMAKEAPDVEEMTEHEKDAAASKMKQRLGTQVSFDVHDTTMNVLSSTSLGVLKLLSEGPLQNFVGGAKANVGLKAGRYMFEVKVLESLRGHGQQRTTLKIGVGTSASGLFLGEDTESVCFDSDAGFVHNGKRSAVGKRFTSSGDIVALLVNLDKSSPNYNTVSLFKDGVRASQPQPLPESLHGKPLYPIVTFGSVTVHVNFGPEPRVSLPFTCRMPQGADEADVLVTPARAKQEKYEVVCPVGLPDEGAFDWLDQFLAKNPTYTELSARAIEKWAEKSGCKPKRKTATDKLELDDGGNIRRILSAAAVLQPRNYVVMELLGNLLKDERAKLLEQFPDADFCKVANVIVGEPIAEFKKHEQELMLVDKQASSDAAFRAKQAAEKQKKAVAKKQRALERERKKAEKAKKKAILEKQKKLVDAKKGADEKQDDEKKEDAIVEEDEDEDKSEAEVEEPEATPPTVELDDAEKKMIFRKLPLPDLTDVAFSSSFAKFCLPSKDEGFDSIKYSWSKAPQAETYFKEWVLKRKNTTRFDHLVPSSWFQTQWSRLQKVTKDWTSRQDEYKQMLLKKESEKKAKALKREQDKRKKENEKRVAEMKKAADKKIKEAERQKKVEEAAKKGEEPPPEEEDKEEEMQAEEPPVEPEVEDDAEEDAVMDPEEFQNLDVFGVEDVCDVENGTPLFKDFQPEDWALLSLRSELHLLAHAFRRDVADPDCSGIFMEHLGFYYQKYFRKQLNFASYGVDSAAALVDLVIDTLQVKNQIITSPIPEELESDSLGLFVKLTEEARRHRSLLIDSGDSAARLKITHTVSTYGAKQDSGNKTSGGYWHSGNNRSGQRSQPYKNWRW